MATIEFRCKNCKRLLSGNVPAGGRRARCPHCGTVLVLPAFAGGSSDGEPHRPVLKTDELADGGPGNPAVEQMFQEEDFASRQSGEAREYRYDAFISYRHCDPDSGWARWLHTSLETYRTPKKLVRTRGLIPRLRRVFRDEDELPASADLSTEIDSALDQSRFLVVICSPRTPKSQWVDKEVQRFRELGRHDRILAVLIEGEPGQSFPRSLCEIRRKIVQAEGLTREQIEEVEPLAADVRRLPRRSARQLRHMAKLRVLACILGCPFDDLRQREHERRRRRLLWAFNLALLLIVAMALLAAIAVHQSRAARWASQQAQQASQQAQKVVNVLENVEGKQADRERLIAAVRAKLNLPPQMGEAVRVVEQAPETVQQLRAARDQILTGRKELQWSAIAEVARQNPTALPPPPSELIVKRYGIDKSRLSELPEQFILTGELGAVRSGHGVTLVYIWSRELFRQAISMKSSLADSRRPLACAVVVFPPSLAEKLWDYPDNAPVRVAVHRWAGPARLPERDKQLLQSLGADVRELSRDGRAVAPGKKATFLDEVPSEMARASYVMFMGDGLERSDAADSWVDAVMGREVRPVDAMAVARQPASVYRAPSQMIGCRMLLTGRYRGFSAQKPNIVLKVHIAESPEGPIEVLLDLGPRPQIREFVDFKRDDWIVANVVVDKIVSTMTTSDGESALPSEAGLHAALHREGLRVNSPVLTDPRLKESTRIPVAWDLLQQSSRLIVKAHWVHLQGRVETLVLAEGPRRPPIVAGDLTPDMVAVDPDAAIGRQVTWAGTLDRVVRFGDRVYLGMHGKGGSVHSNNFEAFAPAVPTLEYLTDYVATEEGTPIDPIIIRGAVVARKEARLTLGGLPVVLQLTEVQRDGDAASRVIVGQTRDAATLRAQTVSDDLTRLFRARPAPGTKVTLRAKIAHPWHKLKRSPQEDIWLEGLTSRSSRLRQRLRFAPDVELLATLKKGDEVEVQAVAGPLAKNVGLSVRRDAELDLQVTAIRQIDSKRPEQPLPTTK